MTVPAGDGRANDEAIDGLYLHRPRPGMAGTPVLELSGDGRESERFVPAGDFMVVQRERDDYRRVCALINAHFGDPALVRRLLDDAGFTADDARAMRSIIAQARSGGV